jgi:aminomethyltransferase
MKYALYGSDIDESTHPYEAGLGWIVKLDKGDFVGREALARIQEAGPSRKLVGFRMAGRAIPRHGYAVLQDGEPVGEVQSGTSSPTLGYGIGTFYAPAARSRPGTPIGVDIRGTVHDAEIVKTPFYTEGSLKR